jgi:hypothetical protein
MSKYGNMVLGLYYLLVRLLPRPPTDASQASHTGTQLRSLQGRMNHILQPCHIPGKRHSDLSQGLMVASE